MSTLPTGTVTFLFTDIEGSTRLWQEEPEAMAVAHARHDVILREAIESNHGYVFQIVGDSFSAAFHNAIDGFYAALAAQRGLNQTSEASGTSEVLKLRVRMGLHTGAAEIDDSNKYAEGYTTLASTQRVMSVAHGRQVLLSHTTCDLLQNDLPENISLRDMGEHRLKDLRSPLRLYQLVAPDLPQDFTAIRSLNALPNNLPAQLTSFIGREKEIAEIQSKIENVRLLTLIGPGGTGKTRLSLQIATAQMANFKDGAWLVELAPISDPALIIATIAAVFELREMQNMLLVSQLLDYLRAKELLLVLDNCEHLVEASAQVADQLLHTCPNLKLVASSREALGIDGETVFRVPSLKDDESTRLFIERATKVEPRFHITDENASAIVQICSRLDGIPLAIELAAARVKLFTPHQIAERLDQRFKLLTGGSRTAALIDWSYQSLNEVEQRALRKLAVFSGGWSFEAAEAVIGESEALDGLLGLVNKSLVNVDEQAGVSRYRFLETIRQYAMEKLVESGEAVETRNRHLDYLLKFFVQVKPDLLWGIEPGWLNQVDVEHDNLRAALEWGVTNDIRKAIQLVLKVNMYWSTRDLMSEALFWYKAILQKTEKLSGYDSERASIYSLLGWNSILIGQHREGRAAAETAIALAKKDDNGRIFVFSACTLALAAGFLGDLTTAQNIMTEAEALAREKGFKEELAFVTSARAQVIYYTTRDALTAKKYLDEAIYLGNEVGYRWETAFLIFGQARLAGMLGDLETARIKFEEGAEAARIMGNKRMVYSNHSEFAHVLRENGRLDEAYAIYKEVIPGWKDLGHRAAVAHELECIGYILKHKEEPERAVMLLSAAQAIRRLIDMPRTQIEDEEYDKEVSTLQGLLGQAEFQESWDHGKNLSMDEAIYLAIEENHE